MKGIAGNPNGRLRRPELSEVLTGDPLAFMIQTKGRQVPHEAATSPLRKTGRRDIVYFRRLVPPGITWHAAAMW
ncbi:MAG TPA: hypothetical protein VMG10_28065 [Gemmataceae bacterium]|nr:hypothetical protein [Gemmataceae bacterium]